VVDNELVKLNQDVIKGYEENIVLPEVRRFNVLEDYDLMVKEFIKFHRLKGNAESGLKTYEYALNRFRKYLINANNFIDAYINMLEEDMRKGTSKPYIKLNTGIVRHFSKHFHLHYEEQLPIFRYELKNPEYVSITDYNRIMEHVDNYNYKIAFFLMYSSGLRISELTHLKVTDLYPYENYIQVRHGKGDKERKIVIPESTMDLLLDYIEDTLMERILRKDGGEYLIISKRITEDGPMCKGSLETVFRKAKRAAGITKKITPHSLRHGYATNLLNDGVSLKVIQEQLGHTTLSTTQHYTHLSPSYRQSELNKTSMFNNEKVFNVDKKLSE